MPLLTFMTVGGFTEGQMRKGRLPGNFAKLTPIICIALLLGACAVAPRKGDTGAAAAASRDREIEDVTRIPQRFVELAEAAGGRLDIDEPCRSKLLDEFRRNFFMPWTSTTHLNDPDDARKFMQQEARGRWFGVNKRRIAPKLMHELLENCALDDFPSRSQLAIAVAPGHLRGLPTPMPFYERADAAPFDMLSYPQVKLNEPLRVLHASRDGVWLFVETVYSYGWLEARDVALVDRAFAKRWMQAAHLAIVKDYTPVPDGRGAAGFRAKIGTILPLTDEGDDWWEARVASAGEGGKAEERAVRIPAAVAARFPLEFAKGNLALIGDQLLGQPYGWGELYDLRDCSAILRDFFLPFGIWLPRTSSDQIASLPRRLGLAKLAAPAKEELIRSKGLPFLSLLYKRGHIMLYVGQDPEGRPLVFHDAWSIRVHEGGVEKTQIIGFSVITSMEPGKELGLVAGSSLLERVTELGTLTERCRQKSE